MMAKKKSPTVQPAGAEGKKVVRITDPTKTKHEQHKGKQINSAIRQEFIDLLLERAGWIDSDGKVL